MEENNVSSNLPAIQELPGHKSSAELINPNPSKRKLSKKKPDLKISKIINKPKPEDHSS
jgi:hypothetical protein